MFDPKFNLTAEEAQAELRRRLSITRASGPRNELKDLDPTTAFDLGYETALFELKQVMGPDTLEAEIIVYTPTTDEESTEDDR